MSGNQNFDKLAPDIPNGREPGSVLKKQHCIVCIEKGHDDINLDINLDISLDINLDINLHINIDINIDKGNRCQTILPDVS